MKGLYKSVLFFFTMRTKSLDTCCSLWIHTNWKSSKTNLKQVYTVYTDSLIKASDSALSKEYNWIFSCRPRVTFRTFGFRSWRCQFVETLRPPWWRWEAPHCRPCSCLRHCRRRRSSYPPRRKFSDRMRCVERTYHSQRLRDLLVVEWG